MAKQRPNDQAPATTEKGTFLLTRDRKYIFTSKRHLDAGSAKTEAKRLGKLTADRILILKVVGVVDKRKTKEAAAQPESTSAVGYMGDVNGAGGEPDVP